MIINPFSNYQLNIPNTEKTGSENVTEGQGAISMPENIGLSGKNNGMLLSSLFVNTETQSAASQALTAAGLIINARNMEMVNAMMKEGLSVDKNSLANMFQTVSGVETEEIGDAVLLNKLGIEVTHDNVEQLHAYLGYEHQVTNAVNDIMALVPETLNQMINDGDELDAFNMARDILDIFSNQGSMVEVDDKTLELSGMNAPIDTYLSDDELQQLANVFESNGFGELFSEAIREGDISLQDFLYVVDNYINDFAESRMADNPNEENIGLLNENIDNNIANETSDIASSNESMMVNKDNTDAINDSESNKQLKESKQSDISKDINSENYNNVLNDNFNSKKHAISLLTSKPMNALLKAAVNNQWRLNPDQVKEDKQVSDLYKRMTEQTNRLLNTINNQAKENTPLAKTVSNLSKNINFMNELNNVFNYVQLPLKMAGNNAHGELYVYSNKKHMASEDGNLSALLHLDMDNLGPTDVYVTLNSANHVNTHFYLPDEESLDLIASHIDELNERIENKGYVFTAEVSPKEEITNIVETIIDDNKSSVPISVSAFDAKI